jgi:hypothetical protein
MGTMIAVVCRNRALALLIALSMIALALMEARAASVRCGWLDNPTPGNASLYDKDGEWTIAVQGGHQATGDWPPTFKPGQWVNSGQGSYGYGCVCLTVEVDLEEKNILNILSGKARPLSVCRKDRAIANIEKQLRP